MELSVSHHSYQCFRNRITGDGKWMLHINYARRRRWLSVGQAAVATPRTDLHTKNAILSMWWGVKGIIHWEIIPNDCSVTADFECQQLDRVAEELKEKQDRIYFLHDNARSQVAE